MKYHSLLPISALFALSLLSLLVYSNLIPPGAEILELIKANMKDGFFVLVFMVILLESIVYIGFYFPGQFFAVVLVVGANPSPVDVLKLTIAMVLAATLGSAINYLLGARFGNSQGHTKNTKLKQLLVAMIHINSLAFFMFAQGAGRKAPSVIAFAGLLNLPYYLLLIAGTAVLSEQVMRLAENTYMLFIALSIWLAIALYFDYKKHRQLP